MSESPDEKKETIREYLNILNPALDELKIAFIGVVNQGEDYSKLSEAVAKLNNARRLINSAENIGIIIGIATFLIAPYPLTGDPKRDLGQTPVNLPDPDNEDKN